MNKIETGVITPTHDYVDGKQVYVKRFDFGTLPNNDEKSLEMGFSVAETTILKIDGCAINPSGSGTVLPLPLVSSTVPITAYAIGTKIYLNTTSNRTSFTKSHVNVYFTYN